MEPVVRRLALDLDDPAHPTFCIRCVEQVFSPGFENDRANARILRQGHRDFLSSALNYLTTPRAADDISTLQIYLDQTIRGCSRRASHAESALLVGDFLLDYAVFVLIRPICGCLKDAPRMLKTQRFSQRGLWPCNIDDILPRGPRETIASFVFWITRAEAYPLSYSHFLLLETLNSLILACRSELVPVVMSEDIRPSFVDTLCRQLDLAVSARRSPLATGLGSATISNTPALCIDVIALLLHELSSGMDMLYDPWLHLIQGQEHHVLRALDAAQSCLDPTTAVSARGALARLQIQIYRQLDIQLPMHLQVLDSNSSSDRDDPYVLLHEMLCIVTQRVSCCAPGCGKHPHEVSAGKLLSCGTCKMVQYCSRECQKQHWSRQGLPHRSACEPLRALLQVAPYSKDQRVFIARCRAPSVSEEIIKTLGARLLAEEMAKTRPDIR